MEFYQVLTKLLAKAHELKDLNNRKKVNHFEKEKYMKEFIEILIAFF